MNKATSSCALIVYINVHKECQGRFGRNQYLVEIANIAVEHPSAWFNQFEELKKARREISLIESMALPGQLRVAEGYHGIVLVDEEDYVHAPRWIREYKTATKLEDAVKTVFHYSLANIMTQNNCDHVKLEIFYDNDVELEQELYMHYKELDDTKDTAVACTYISVFCAVVVVCATILGGIALAVANFALTCGAMLIAGIAIVLAMAMYSKACKYTMKQIDIQDEISRKRNEIAMLRR